MTDDWDRLELRKGVALAAGDGGLIGADFQRLFRIDGASSPSIVKAMRAVLTDIHSPLAGSASELPPALARALHKHGYLQETASQGEGTIAKILTAAQFLQTWGLVADYRNWQDLLRWIQLSTRPHWFREATGENHTFTPLSEAALYFTNCSLIVALPGSDPQEGVCEECLRLRIAMSATAHSKSAFDFLCSAKQTGLWLSPHNLAHLLLPLPELLEGSARSSTACLLHISDAGIELKGFHPSPFCSYHNKTRRNITKGTTYPSCDSLAGILIASHQVNLGGPAITWQATAASPLSERELSRAGRANCDGTGCDLDIESAQLKAEMEAMERYASMLYRPAIRQRAFGALDSKTVHPTRLIGFRHDQYSNTDFPFRAFDDDEEMDWVSAISLQHGCSTLIAADFVFYPGQVQRPLTQVTSNGCAAHSSLSNAWLSGFFELLERDGVMLWWFTSIKRGLVRDLESISELRSSLAFLDESGFTIRVEAVIQEFDYPVFIAQARNNSDAYPAFAIGAGCDPSPICAIKHAVLELVMVVCSLKKATAAFAANVRSISTPLGHRTIHAQDGSLSRETAHFQTVSVKDFVTRDRGQCVEDHLLPLWERGFAAYGLDLTSADLRQCGVYVGRVIVPGLIPLHFGPHQPLRAIEERAATLGVVLNLARIRVPHPLG